MLPYGSWIPISVDVRLVNRFSTVNTYVTGWLIVTFGKTSLQRVLLMRFSQSPRSLRGQSSEARDGNKTSRDRDGCNGPRRGCRGLEGTNVRPRDIFVSDGRTARVVPRASRTGGRSNWAKSVLTIEETTERKKNK